jgi:hypothetical protein
MAVITKITNDNGYVSGSAELPFFGTSVEVTLDSESKEDIAFEERQIALLSALPIETYTELCRHTVDYAADLVDYVGEYMGMYDEEDFKDEIIPAIEEGDFSELASDLERWFSEKKVKNIVKELKKKIKNDEPLTRDRLLYLIGQVVLDLGYYKDNFHHVWPAVQNDLEHNPLNIMRFITLTSVSFEHLMDDEGKEVLAANLGFNCDWEPEHGLEWSIVDKKVYCLCSTWSF